MNTFPLYDQLYSSSTTKFVSKKKKNDIIESINTFDDNQREHLYVIIKLFQMNNDDAYMYKLPYGADCVQNEKIEGKYDITFDLEKFPPKLKNMLHSFCELTKNI